MALCTKHETAPARGQCRCGFLGDRDDVWGLEQLPPDRSRLWEPGVKKSVSGDASAPQGSLQEMQSAGFPVDANFRLLNLLGCFIRQPLRLGFSCLNFSILRKG